MNHSKPTIRLAAASQDVQIVLSGPLYDSTPDELRATIIAKSGAFHGEVITTIWWYQLRALHDLLLDLNRNVGHPERKRWHDTEAQLTLTFELTQVGHVQVHVELLDRSDDWAMETALRFTIRADQTYLPVWIEQVTQALDSMTP